MIEEKPTDLGTLTKVKITEEREGRRGREKRRSSRRRKAIGLKREAANEEGGKEIEGREWSGSLKRRDQIS